MRFADQKNAEDTESSSESYATSDEEFWDWYESEGRTFDSFTFPPGFFIGSGSDLQDPSAEDDLWLPRRGQMSQTHCWDDADVTGVCVRSQSYLQDKIKEQSTSPMLELRSADLFSTQRDCSHYSADLGGMLPRLRQQGDDRFFFVLNFCLQPLQLAIIWAEPENPPWKRDPPGRLFKRFLGGMLDDERNGRLKLLPKVVEGPWHVKAMVPSKPVLIGRQCPVTYFADDRHLEASIDCGASAFGRKLSQLLMGGTCVVALFVILEGQSEDELPERLLGGVALHRTEAGRIASR